MKSEDLESLLSKDEAIKLAYDYITAKFTFKIRNPSAWFCPISKDLSEETEVLRGKWSVGFDIDEGPSILASTAACRVLVDPSTRIVSSIRDLKDSQARGNDGCKKS